MTFGISRFADRNPHSQEHLMGGPTSSPKAVELAAAVVPAQVKLLDWTQSEVRLGDEICDSIIELGSSYQPIPGKVGDDTLKDYRQALVHKLQREEKSASLFQFLGSLIGEFNELHYGFDLQGLRNPEYIEYRAGFGRFDWHHDYAYVSAEGVRKLTMIVQLSEAGDYEGGHLQVFGAPPVDLPTERGSIVAFPSWLYHRVTPVTKGLRRSLVVWAWGPPLR